MTDQPLAEKNLASSPSWALGWFVGDLRSLAIWRIGLGVAILWSILSFLNDLDLYYSEQGVLPRLLFLKTPALSARYSLLIGCSNTAQIGLLAALEALAAISLMLGYRARLSAAICWTIHWSFLNRNPMICDRGDMELGLLLFYAMFMPLGSRWGYQETRNERPASNRWRSWVWFAVLAQISQIYLFAGLLKHGAAWTGRGDGLKLSLECALFARPTAVWLASMPGLKAMNYLVIVGEVLLGLCLWGSSKMRQTAVLLIAFFHILVSLLFDLGGFPWIGAVGCLVLLPESFWTGPGRVIENWMNRRFEPYHTETKTKPVQLARASASSNLWAGTCAVYVMACNLYTCSSLGLRHLPQPIRYFGQLLNLEQHWELFAPYPPFDGWFALEAEDSQGTRNLLSQGHDGPVRPTSPAAYYPRYRIKMLLVTTLFHQNEFLKAQICRAIAQKQNANGSKLKLLFWVREVEPGGLKAPLSSRLIWAGDATESKPQLEGKKLSL
jgi:hypothetical protein